MQNMKKIILLTLWLLSFSQTFATSENIVSEESQSINYEINILEELNSQIKTNISINTPYEVDLSGLEEKLKILYPNFRFSAKWDIAWASSQEGFVFKRMFKEKGLKDITFTIYKISSLRDESWRESEEQESLYIKNYELLVYEKSLAVILSPQVEKTEIENYIQFSKNDGTYVHLIGPLSKTDIELNSLLTSLQNYHKTSWLKSDYISIWWERDFIVDVLSKINREAQANKELIPNSLNLVGISPYNIHVLKNYLWNFLVKKDWIQSFLLLNEEWKYLILKQNQITELKKELEKNQHQFVNIDLQEKGISNALFISNFVNNLSNLWYTTNNIYIFLIIPFILAGISFFRHFIGFSPIWVVIPLFITLLFFKLWFFATLALIFIYLIFNLGISLIVDRYNLLYTPKISFILTLNIVFFIILFNVASSLEIVVLNLTDILYFIVFIIISEKFINIIISKDLSEYKSPFFYTILISSVCFWLLNISEIKLLILAYPEIIMALVPINFLMGRFTWLRVTEYFRFKEIIKSVEEE